MSAYTDAVNTDSNGPRFPLLKVERVIRTPHGNIIAGQEYEASLVGWDEIGHDEIGSIFSKIGRGIGKAGKGFVKLHAKLGKAIVKGHVNAFKWARKNPLKALAAVAVPSHALTYFVGKKAIKALKRKKRGGRRALPSRDYRAGQAREANVMSQQAQQRLLGPSPPPPPDGDRDMDSATDDDGPIAESLADSRQRQAEALDAADDADRMSESEDQQEDEQDQTADASEDDSDDEADVSGTTGAMTMADEEYVGLDEIAGEEWVSGDDDVGAVRRTRRRAGPNAALVRQHGYNKARRQALPLASSGTVAGAASATVSVVAQTLFRGRKLVVPAAIAPSFTIDDLKVGNVSQFAAAGSHSAEAFAPTTTGEDNLQMDTCPAGMSIILSVTNTSGGALQFRATIFGDSVQ